MAYSHPIARTGRGKAGVTLIELLLAMGIAVLLVLLLYSIYHTVAQTAVGQDDRHKASRPMAETIDTLLQDLATLVLPDHDDTCRFVLQPGTIMGDRFDELASCTAAPSPDQRDARWAVFQRVRHRVVKVGDVHALIRESNLLTGPGSAPGAATNTLLAGIARFQVEIYDGTEWHRTWPPEGEDREPSAARIAFMREGDPEPTRIEVPIAAGFPFVQAEK